MTKTMAIVVVFLATCAVIDASCNGNDTEQDPFSDGYNAQCGFSYQTGCKLGQMKYAEAAYDAASEALGGYLSFISSLTAGFACGLCESGFLSDGSTTTAYGKGTQCSNNECDKEAKCCPQTDPQCGNSAFQIAFKAEQPASCHFGYRLARGQYGQLALEVLGTYLGIVLCGTQGYFACSPIIQALGASGIVAQIAANITNAFQGMQGIL